ncbi:hypothetical protein WOLCODRAFT_34004, partial [Wolfiporia cocos MD-104 SS10]
MLIIGDFVHCPTPGEIEILRDHLIGMHNAGFINHVAPVHLEESRKILDQAREHPISVEQGSFITPTFCDLHLHAPQFLYQGTGLHLPLMKWLDEYAFKAEERLDADHTLAEKVYRQLAVRLVENGTGAVLLFGTIKSETNLILARVMQEAGIRAFVGKLSMDISSRPSYVEASADDSLAAARSFVAQCRALTAHLPEHERLVEPVLTPRFVPTCSDKLLDGLGELAKEQYLRVQSHMAEAHDQVEWVRRERGTDDMAIFKRYNLLTPRAVLAHCTFLEPDALTQLAAAGPAIAHCPLSNAYFSARPLRLREALNAGVRVGLGSDIAGGYDASIAGGMRQAVAVSRMREGARIVGGDELAKGEKLDVDWKEALYLATRGGAIALGLAEWSGTFVVGAPFDAQCIRLFDRAGGIGVGPLDFLDFFDDDARGELTLEMLEKWWCIGDHRNRANMWVQGKKI